MTFAAKVISCLLPHNVTFLARLCDDFTAFMAGIFQVREIGLLKGFCWVPSHARGNIVGVVEQLLGRIKQPGMEDCLYKASLLKADRWILTLDPGHLRARSQQQAACLVVRPEEDEASQADGCHSRDDTCKQAERRMGKAVSWVALAWRQARVRLLAKPRSVQGQHVQAFLPCRLLQQVHILC